MVIDLVNDFRPFETGAVLSAPQLAVLYGVSVSTVYRWARRGLYGEKMPAHRDGTFMRFHLDETDGWVSRSFNRMVGLSIAGEGRS